MVSSSLLSTSNKRSTYSVKPFLFASLVPAALLGFGAFALLLAHQSIGDTKEANLAAWGIDGYYVSTSPLLATLQQSLQQSPQGAPKQLPDGSLAYPPAAQPNDYFVQHPADAYVNAFYLDDTADYETPQMLYEDDHILQLLANTSHVPFNIHRSPNGTSVLTKAGNAHPVLTALRDLDETEDFFNPVCFRYRFPNVSAFPTMSVIVPMQNGTYLNYTRFFDMFMLTLR